MRYKVTLMSGYLYREIELTEETTRLRIGTGTDADVRFRSSDFLGAFSIDLFKQGNFWQIECGDGIYIESGKSQKILVYRLKKSDRVTIHYSNTDAGLFELIFCQDFEYEEKKYNRVIELNVRMPLKIGGGELNQIRLPGRETEKDNLVIERNEKGQYILQITSSGVGTRLNGNEAVSPVILHNHDFFSIGTYFFCLVDGRLYTDSDNGLVYRGTDYSDEVESISHFQYPKFNRSTRIREIISEEKITVLDPPKEPQKPRENIVTQLFPAIGMLVVTILIRGVLNSTGGTFVLMSVCTIGIGLLTSIMNIITSRKDYKADTQKRLEAYHQYIENKKEDIDRLRNKEREALNNKYILPQKQVQRIQNFSPELFERQPCDEDFAEVRLGSGEKKALREIDYKKKDEIEVLDELVKIPGQIAREYKMLSEVPITIKVKDCTKLGVVGEREALYRLLKVFTLDLAAHQYYTDVKFVYCIEEEDRKQFEWTRLLPQVQNEYLNRRNIICDEESKSVLLDYLYKVLSARDKDTCLPHVVVFVYRERGIQKHPISEMIHKDRKRGVTFIYFQEFEESLPQECDYIVRMTGQYSGEKVTCTDINQTEKFVIDDISDEMMEKAAWKLAPVYCDEISLESSLTKNISFFELFGIYEPADINLGASWNNSKVYESMAAPLGVKAKDQVIYLDLNEKHHGPHGLVAGTTGSGKSEILQSYILSMSLLYHPYEVGFVIIDFKGGGMVNQFKDLPHLIGSITNIDGREIDRSLLSIRAELKKRQELSARYGVNHIDAYIRLFQRGETKTALPHLILIVDEFAELKMDQPEFMKELISASRIGRSLGVHLILATQKPSGVVDPQIWSNSKFKLCLKVQSREDSNEVLKSPLAAEIVEPGRAYLQVGNNEIFELFQSAYSGGSAFDTGEEIRSFEISRLSLEGKRIRAYKYDVEKDEEESESQLESIVRYISGYCEKAGIARLPFIFLPSLPERLDFEYHDRDLDLGGYAAYLGMYDDPANQYQGDMMINVTLGNTFIIGSAQYGKTNLLQTILRSLSEQYSPREVNFYILDFGSMIFKNFEGLNHVGGVVCAADDEKCKNLFRLLENEIKKRKEILVKSGVSSFASYLEAGFSDLCQIVVMIDNLTAMREMYLMENDFLLPMCRDGAAVGISFIIANAQTSGIGYRYLSNFEQRIALYCNENTEYAMILDNCHMRPYNVPGRCLFSQNKMIYEAQSYLAFDGGKEIERVAQILDFVKERNACYADQYAKEIPEVPNELTEEIMKRKFRCSTDDQKFAIGVDYGTVQPVTEEWGMQNLLGISGKDALGRQLFLNYMVSSFLRIHSRIYISDDIMGTFSKWKDEAALYSRNLQDLPDILSELQMELDDALDTMVQGQYDKENSPAYIWIIHNRNVPQEIAKDKNCLEQFRKMVGGYGGIKLMIIYSDLENASIGFQSPEPLKMLKDNRNYLVFDNLDSIKLFDTPGTVARKYKKPLEPGEAYMLRENALSKVKVIQQP